MKAKSQVCFLSALLLIMAGCGGTEGTSAGGSSGGGGGAGVGIDGTVETPTSSSKSISIGGSASEDSEDSGGNVSKGISNGASGETNGESEERIVVVKATSDTLANGGTVTAKTPTGTTLDTGTITTSGAISGIVIDPSKLDSTKQVLLECDVAGKKFTKLVDLTDKKTGDTVDAKAIDSDSTLAVQQVYFQADPTCSPDNPSVCASKFLSGEIKPLALFQVFSRAYDVNSTAGSSDAGGAYQAMRKAFSAAMANGKPSFSDINSALAGGGILGTWKSLEPELSGIDMGAAIAHVQNYIPAVAKTFQDDSTFAKYRTAGTNGWASCAQFFGKKTGDDLKNDADNPAAIRGFLAQKATSFINGDTAAFDTMKKAGFARMMSQFASNAGSTAFTSAQFEALEKLVDAQKVKFDTLSSAQFANFGGSLFNQIKACNTTAEIDLLKKNPGSFIGKIFDKPAFGTGSGGADIFNNQFTTFVQNPDGFNSGGGCFADTDCNAPLSLCGPVKFCVAPCTSNCPFGSKCTTNGQCATGSCVTGGFCGSSDAGAALGGVLSAVGSTCTAASGCASGICSGGVCSGVVATGDASFAGFYKKNSGGTLKAAININGISGSTTVTFGPNDPSNPQLNSVFGYCTLTGSASPFSIASCSAVTNPSGTAGTIVCDGSGGSTTLALSSGTLTGTCVLGGGLSGSLTVDHTKL